MIPRRMPRLYPGQLSDILRFVFSKKSIQDNYVEHFEKKFAEYIGTKFAITINSGRAGLGFLLQAYGLREGDEILVPAYTLKDLIRIIRSKGVIPRIIDIQKDSFNMDPAHVERNIGPRTKAILATHIFGLPCNIEGLAALAKKNQLRLIEDCAHAMGAKYKNKKVGSWGDSAIFSLDFTKNINTFGGGIITSDDEGVYSFIREKIHKLPFLKSPVAKKALFFYLQYYLSSLPFLNLFLFLFCFKSTSALMEKLYFNLADRTSAHMCRFTQMQAFMGLNQLEELDEMNANRINLAYQLDSFLKENSLIRRQSSNAEDDRVYYFYVIRLLKYYDLYKLRRKIFFQGIDCGIFSEITDNCALIIDGDCPNANEIFKTTMQLPLFDNMKISQIKKIAASVNTILNS